MKIIRRCLERRNRGRTRCGWCRQPLPAERLGEGFCTNTCHDRHLDANAY